MTRFDQIWCNLTQFDTVSGFTNWHKLKMPVLMSTGIENSLR